MGFKASSGWLPALLSRKGLVQRRRTSCTRVAVAERLQRIRRFHSRLLQRRQLAPKAEKSSDVVYDCWLPTETYNQVHVLVLFPNGQATTIELTGADRVHIIHGASGDDKKEVTAHLACIARKVQCGVDVEGNPVYQNGAQRKRAMISRGLGKRICTEAKAQWDPQVHVVFQKKAWADTHVMITYAHHMAANSAVDRSKSSIWHMGVVDKIRLAEQ